MNRSDTIGAMRANDGKVCHPNLAFGSLLDQTDPLHPSLVSRKTFSDFINQAAIDFVDDLQMTRQHDLKPTERPFFKSLREQRMIRVGQSPLGKIPSLVPAEMRFIEQNPHQLWHRHRRMRIVE